MILGYSKEHGTMKKNGQVYTQHSLFCGAPHMIQPVIREVSEAQAMTDASTMQLTREGHTWFASKIDQYPVVKILYTRR